MPADLFTWNEEKILIADDDQYSYLLLEKVFRKTGATINHAYDGLEAYKLLMKDQTITIAILDILMPKMTGIEVIKRVKKNRNDVIFIAYTADVLRMNKEECMEMGFSACIPKPTLPAKILIQIQQLLLVRQQENIKGKD